MKLNNEHIPDKNWADHYLPEIRKTILKFVDKILSIEPSTEEEDQQYNADYVLTVSSGKIACRIRRPSCKYRDFTIRAWRKLGTKTELQKIKEGFGKWYLYAWAKNNYVFDDWMLIDLDKFRASGLLNTSRDLTQNPDGTTGFIHFNLSELYLGNCIVQRGVYTLG
jgi:hypothetical protein